MFTYELARRLASDPSNPTVNALHPVSGFGGVNAGCSGLRVGGWGAQAGQT